jgi:outer membrane protein assembly factor BamB
MVLMDQGTVWFANGTSVSAMDLASGRPIWQRTTQAVRGIVLSGSMLVVLEHDGLSGLDGASGQPRWRHELTTRGANALQMNRDPSGRASMTPLAGSLVYVNADGAVVALDARDGTVVWTHPIVKDASFGPVLIGDTLYQAVFLGTLYALDPATGTERWSWMSRSRVAITGELEVTDDSVVVMTTGLLDGLSPTDPPADAAQLVSLSARDGSVNWSLPVGDDHGDVVRLVGSQLVAVTGPRMDPDPGVIAVDAQTGTVTWTVPGAAFATSAASVLTFGPFHEDPITSVDPATGGVRWTFAEGGVDVAVDVGDNVLLAFGGTVTAHNSQTGAEVWRSSRQEPVRSLAVTDGNRVLAVTADWPDICD